MEETSYESETLQIEETSSPKRSFFHRIKARYLITLGIILVTVILLFFYGEHNIAERRRVREDIANLELQQKRYLEQIEEVSNKRKALTGSPEEMEKYAREEMHMKKENEDIYQIQ